ncbi:MAG: LamG domain-containing protein [Planctomycetota bacterium]
MQVLATVRIAAAVNVLAAGVLCATVRGADVLLVTASSSLTSQETLRKTQFEAWGHTVATIEDGDSQANFDTAMASADVVWVSEEVNSSSVGYKLRSATIGVIHEEAYIDDYMGFATTYGEYWNSSSVTLTDNTHEITSGLTLGTLTLTSVTETLTYTYGTEAAGAQPLADYDGGYDLAVLEPGATLANSYSGNSTASGRRVRLPWGGSNFNWSNLNSTGLLIAQRSIDWAAGPDATADLDLDILLITAGSSLSSEETARKNAFESWNCVVTTVQDSESESVLLTAAAAVDVVYVPQTASAADLGDKLRTARVGVVHEGISGWDDNVGWTTSVGYNANTSATMTVTDNTHSITETFSTGTLTIYDSSSGAYGAQINGTPAAGASQLGTNLGINSGLPNLLALEAGADLANTVSGNSAAWGRRVHLPFGGFGTPAWTNISTDGETLIQRSLAWAAEKTLVGHWKLDESSGTTAEDSSDFGNDGTYTGSPTLGQAGLYGYSANFNGTNQYVTVAGGDDLNLRERVTVSCWAKSDTATWSGWGCLVSKRNQFYLHPSFGGTYVYMGADTEGSGDKSAGFDMAALGGIQEWHHYVGVYDYDAGEVRFYVDGELRATTSVTAGTLLENDSGNLTIGWDDGISGTRYLDGNIDDVRVYARAISAEEVRELFGLVGHYKLDETSGTTAVDSSGFGIDGTYGAGVTLGETGVRGLAAGFDATDNVVTVSGGASLDLRESISVGCWARSDTATWNQTGCLVSKRNQMILHPWAGGTLLSFYVYLDGAWTSVNADVGPVDRWRQYVGVYNQHAGTLELYADGELVGNATVSTSAVVSADAGELLIGGDDYATSRRFDGAIDDVVLYNRAITDEEIAKHYGLIGRWRLNETSGTVAADSSGLGHDGDHSGGTTLGESGVRSFAAAFDGVDGEITTEEAADALDGADAVSIAAWVRPDGTISSSTRIAGNGRSEGFRLDVTSANKPRFHVHLTSGKESLTANTELQAGRWTQLTGVFDGNKLRIYINGELDREASVSSSPLVENDHAFIIGNDTSGSGPFEGLIDDVVAYSRAMTDHEIAEHYGLVGHWKLDETSGTTAADSSGYGIDLAATGTPTWATDGVRSGAATFGSSDYFSCDAGAYESTITEAISFACWFRLDDEVADLTSHAWLANFVGTDGADMWISKNGHDLRFRAYAADGSNSTKHGDELFLLPGGWHQAVGVYDGSEVRLYFDGQLYLTSADTDGLAPPTGSLSIGQSMAGGMDDVQLYNRVMTEEEIAEHHGLIGHWKLDETSGTAAADSTLMGGDGVILGSPTMLVEGPRNGDLAMRFDGVDDAVMLPAFDSDAFADGVTLACWVKPIAVGSEQKLIQIAELQTYRIDLGRTGTTTTLQGNVGDGGGAITATGALHTGAWHHYAMTVDATGLMRLFRDGSIVSETQQSPVPTSKRTTNWIGDSEWPTDALFEGDVHDVRVYNRAASAEEIESLYFGQEVSGLRIIRWVEIR